MVLQIHGLHSSVGHSVLPGKRRWCCCSPKWSKPSHCPPPLNQEKTDRQVGNCLSFPLLSWQIYMQPRTSFSFLLQSQCSKCPLSFSRLVAVVVYGFPPFDTGGTAMCPFSSPVFTVYLSTLLYSQHLLINMSKSQVLVLLPSGWKQLLKSFEFWDT